MAGEVGGVLEIPQSLFTEFNKIDERLKQVGTYSEEMSKKFTGEIDKMTESLGNLNIKLGDIQTTINNIDLSKITTNVDKLSEALSQIGKVDSRGISNTESSLQKESDLAKKTYLDKLSMYERLWKKMDDDAKKAEDTATRRALAEERANERIRKAQELSAKREAFAKTTTFEGAMDFAKSANSINQRIDAIKRLTIARNNLSTSTDNYDKKLNALNNAILKLNKANADAIAGSKEMKKQHSALMDTSGQLARKFALIFSVSQIQGYVRQLVAVRGEFELQQRALQAILQNKDEADKLFSKVTELAVRSPYQVKELVTYTKQLAAYRVESSKLYDTTKMLADVSSGLGVDMQRLILAYGQVKAANYLRGTELRQFSEAGINILGELATYFSELKGQAISVGDVFEMVSNRMVSFADVEEIFKRITSAGGIFYNMQEIQAETLKGQLSNLRDEIDLMFNEIGKANEGTLKNAVSIVKSLVENWQIFAPIIKGLVVSFGALKLVALASSKSILEFAVANNIATISSGKMVSLLGLLQIGFKKVTLSAKSMGKSLASIFKGNIWTIAITALLAGVYELYSAFSEHSEQLDEINKKYNDLYSSVKDVNVKFDYAISSNDLGEQKKLLSSLINIANNDYQMNIKIDYSNMTSEKVIEEFNKLKQSITDTNRIAKIFATTMQETTEWTIQDDIFEDFEQLGSAFNTLDDYVYRTKTEVMNYLVELGDSATKTEKEVLKALQTPRQDDKTKAGYENELQYLERLRQGYILLSKDSQMLSKYGLNIGEMAKVFGNITRHEKEATKEFNNFADNLKKKMPSLMSMSEEDKTQYIKFAIDKIALDKEWDTFQTLMMYKLANTKFNVSIGFDATQAPDNFSTFEKKFQEYQDKKGFTFKYKIEAGKGQPNIVEDLKSQLDGAEKTLALWENANKKMDVYTDAEIKAQKVMIEEIRDLWLAAGGALSTTTTTKSTGKSVYEQRLDVLKQIQSQYDKLLPYFSKEEALQKVILNNQKEINSVGLKGIEDLSKGGLVKILYDMLNTIPAGAKDARKAIEKELSTLKVDVDIDIAKNSIENMKKSIDDIFSDFDFAKNLENMGIDSNAFKTILNNLGIKDIGDLTITSFIDMAKKAEESILALRAKGTKEAMKLADDAEKELNKRRLSYAQDLAKKYIEYTKKSISEKLQIEIDAENKIAEVRKNKGILGLSDSEVNSTIAKIRENAQKAKDALSWRDFQESDMYIKIFEDLDYVSSNVLDAMEKKLISLRKSLNSLSPTELKEITRQIEKIQERKSERSPLSGMTEDLKDYISFLKQRKELEDKWLSAEENISALKEKADIQQKIVKDAEKEYNKQVQLNGINSSSAISAQTLLKIEEDKLDVILKELVAQGKISQELADQIRLGEKATKSLSQKLSNLSGYFDDFSNTLLSVASSLESVFGTMDEATADTISSIAEISSGLGEMAGGASRILSGDIIGGSMQAIRGLASTIGSIFSIGDKKKERQIQKEIKAIEDLQIAYEKLEKAIDSAYSLDTLKEANNNAKENLEAQISSYERMIASEESKKKTDKNKIKEWQGEIDALKGTLEELEQQNLEILGGIGDGVRDAAQEFVDAWAEAYMETGDGLTGLENKWDEYIDNIIKKQMMLKATTMYLKPLFDSIDAMFAEDSEGGSEVTKNELNDLEQQKNAIFPALDEFLKGLARALGLGEGGTEAGQLSGLQQGIQGVTEQTAQALEAYMNSIRFFVADSNSKLNSLYFSLMSTDANINPMYEQLRLQTIQVTAINKLLNSVAKAGHSQGGYGIKVFM